MGLVEYQEALAFQQRLAFLRRRDEVPDTLFLLEHPPTYTLGRKSDKRHFFVPNAWIESGQVTAHNVDRGGGITFHGPGQLVGYPVIKLRNGRKDIVSYIRNLEDMLIGTLSVFGIQGSKRRVRRNGLPITGVWVGDEKIAAIGIKVDTHMVTNHGFALNVNTDLSYFEKIIPCGIHDKAVTSMASLLGHTVPMKQVTHHVMTAFSEIFDCELITKHAA